MATGVKRNLLARSLASQWNDDEFEDLEKEMYSQLNSSVVTKSSSSSKGKKASPPSSKHSNKIPSPSLSPLSMELLDEDLSCSPTIETLPQVPIGAAGGSLSMSFENYQNTASLSSSPTEVSNKENFPKAITRGTNDSDDSNQ